MTLQACARSRVTRSSQARDRADQEVAKQRFMVWTKLNG